MRHRIINAAIYAAITIGILWNLPDALEAMATCMGIQ